MSTARGRGQRRGEGGGKGGEVGERGKGGMGVGFPRYSFLFYFSSFNQHLQESSPNLCNNSLSFIYTHIYVLKCFFF